MAYKQLKRWFDKDLATMLANKICPVQPDFNTNRFVTNVDKKTIPLELKGRVELICDELFTELGSDYETGVNTLLQILGPENPKETGTFTEFYWVMPIAKYVEKYGLAAQHFDLSMNALAEITKRNTSEYAIRPYLQKYTEATLEVMKKWSGNESFHIRRLASEGIRPRLPWAKKLDIFIKHPQSILPILENLKDDQTKYVQKSVANCVNDILKDNFEVGKELIEKWNTKPIGKQRKQLIKHALRRLIKAKNEWALRIIN